MAQEVQTQFVLELPREVARLSAHDPTLVHRTFGAALLLLFGLPITTPVHLRIRLTDRFQLLEANGRAERTPEPLEVQGAMLGAYAALQSVLIGQATVTDLRTPRVTDA